MGIDKKKVSEDELSFHDLLRNVWQGWEFYDTLNEKYGFIEGTHDDNKCENCANGQSNPPSASA